MAILVYDRGGHFILTLTVLIAVAIESYPSGEIRLIERPVATVGRDPLDPPRDGGHPTAPPCDDGQPPVSPRLDGGEVFGVGTGYGATPPPPSPLTNDADSSGKPRKRTAVGFGELPKTRKVFGSRQVKNLLNAGQALEAMYPRANCLFLTGTCPGTGDDIYEAIARWSGYAAQSIRQWLNRLGCDYFYKWEYQKRGALHIHIAVGCPDGCTLIEILASWKEKWAAILDYISKVSGINVWSRPHGPDHNLATLQADCQIVQKSIARYLSKYTAKVGHDAQTKDLPQPSSFWGQSRGISSWVKKRIFRIDALFPIQTAKLWIERLKERFVTRSYSDRVIRHKYSTGSTYAYFSEPSECTAPAEMVSALLECIPLDIVGAFRFRSV